MPSEIEKAYIAGLFDGEGCICVCTQLSMSIYVFISNTCEEVIDRLMAAYPAGRKSMSNPNIMNRPMYRFDLDSRSKMLEFLRDIQPFLTIKREHVKYAIPLLESRLRRNHHDKSVNGPTPEEIVCAIEIRALNARGRKEVLSAV